MQRTFHSLENKFTLWNAWIKGQHFTTPFPDVTPFIVSDECLVSRRIADRIAGKPETKNFEGKLAQNNTWKLCIQQLNLASVAGTQGTNSVMDFWRKVSSYQTALWTQGHNLSFRDASLWRCVIRSTPGEKPNHNPGDFQRPLNKHLQPQCSFSNYQVAQVAIGGNSDADAL